MENWLLVKDLFGSFAIHDKSSFLIGLKTKESKNMIYYYYFFIIFLLIIFAVLNNARIHRLINNVIARPIQKLVKNVKTDSVLERSNQSLQEINYLIEQIGLWKTQIKASQEIEKRAVLLDLAAKVAHDIGSPIVVMETIVHSVSKDIPREDVAILHEALQSVRDIANNLLLKYRQTDSQDESNIYNISGTSSDEPRYILLFSLVKQVVVHKRQEWKRDSCEIVLENDPAAKFIWTKCNPNEIKRMLSNLLNNSYEALRETRRIIVKLKQTQDDIQLCIRDTGIGISQDMIENVLHGISLKHAGKGLGLSGAKTYMQSIGGNLNLISEKNKYTEVILNFPREAPPIWFPSKITIPHDAHIAILDDDPAIHGLWKHLFQNTSVKVTHFLNSEELINWHESIINESKQIVCLFDYELKDDIYNGLSMLKKLKIKNGYLVTSHAETFAIQETISPLC
jgi:signal transduction histidine kinase